MITGKVNHSVINVTVSLKQLIEIAECSERMTEYADANGSLLITIMHDQQGEPVRLILDKHCIQNQRGYQTNPSLDSS